MSFAFETVTVTQINVICNLLLANSKTKKIGAHTTRLPPPVGVPSHFTWAAGLNHIPLTLTLTLTLTLYGQPCSRGEKVRHADTSPESVWPSKTAVPDQHTYVFTLPTGG